MANPTDNEGLELARKINLRLQGLRADIAALEATVAGLGSASAYTDLTDAATAALPTLNTPLSEALATKQPSGDYATNTALAGKANLTGGNTFTGPGNQILNESVFTEGVSFAGLSYYDTTATWTYAGAVADTHLTALGGTAPTGTGAIVRAGSPQLTTPNIGAATGTSLTLSGPASVRAGTNSFRSIELTGTTGGVSIIDTNFVSVISAGQYCATFVRGGFWRLRNDTGISWSGQNASPNDTPILGISRLADAHLAIGNGSAIGNAAGSISLTNLTASGTVSAPNINIGPNIDPAEGLMNAVEITRDGIDINAGYYESLSADGAGRIKFKSYNSFSGFVFGRAEYSANQSYTLPDATGTLAITSSPTGVPDHVVPANVETTLTALTGNFIPTGTGGLVRATSPTLTTPNIGAATGTSLGVGQFTISGNSIVGSSVVYFGAYGTGSSMTLFSNEVRCATFRASTGMITTNLTASGTVKTGSMTVAVATASSSATAVAAGAGATTYITDEAGGATTAFSDGTVWRRVSDRSSIS